MQAPRRRGVDNRLGVFSDVIDSAEGFRPVRLDEHRIRELLPATDPFALPESLVLARKEQDDRRRRPSPSELPFVPPAVAAYEALVRKLAGREALPSKRTRGPAPKVLRELQFEAGREAADLAERLLLDAKSEVSVSRSLLAAEKLNAVLGTRAGRRAIADALNLHQPQRQEPAAIVAAIALSVAFAASVARPALLLAQRLAHRDTWRAADAEAFVDELRVVDAVPAAAEGPKVNTPIRRIIDVLMDDAEARSNGVSEGPVDGVLSGEGDLEKYLAAPTAEDAELRARMLRDASPEHLDVWCAATAAANARALLARDLFVDDLPAKTWIELVQRFVHVREMARTPLKLRRAADDFWARAEGLLISAGARGSNTSKSHPTSLARIWDDVLRNHRNPSV